MTGLKNKLKNYLKNLSIVKKIIYSSLLLFFLIFIFLPYKHLFNDPLSIVVEAQNGEFISAHIAADEQWRFPKTDSVPYKFKKSIILFEDKRFNYHFGFDPIAILRALWLNVKNRAVISGGSTITMQVIRLSRKGKSRTIKEKLIEILLASRIEMAYSKDEIMTFYASYAPFGGNVVGLEAASWRYFGRKAKDLSWAEAAMLAILPNSPSLIHLGRNRKKLIEKRNRLLKRLYEEGELNKENYLLSIEEPIPEKPRPFPQKAPYLLTRIINDKIKGKIKNDNSRIKTTIDAEIQERTNNILMHHSKTLASNHIYNAAVLILDVESGNVLAYSGNIYDKNDKKYGRKVDITTAARSTGSVLKPILYASMLTAGDILPNALIPDIPLFFRGYSPQNFNMKYDGAVRAHRALARSLNIPAINLLKDYGVSRFHYILNKAGLKHITEPPDHYGLALILGGCEASLWELGGLYASMARSLNHFTKYNGKYNENDYKMPSYIPTKKKKEIIGDETLFSAAALWLTFEAMLNVERPDEENNWESFASSSKVAWKTGTSFGFRDAWAIGINPKYLVGVWAGNADGEGRAGLIGVRAAAPILFDVFDMLPAFENWFEQPFDEMIKAPICRQSGFLPSENCEDIDSTWIPENGLRFKTCPYHKIVHLDKTEKWQVNSNCEKTQNMIHKSWFVLPPAMESYYKSTNPNYKVLPPFRKDCRKENNRLKYMQLIYPQSFTKIYVPIELSGKTGSTVFEVAHRIAETKIFWYIDDKYIGETKNFHQKSLNPSEGKHKLTLTDENGEQISIDFEIVKKETKNK